MNELHKAEAAAREALAAADASLQSNAGPKAMLDDHYDACAGCADALRDLLAALDAARGGAVAWRVWRGDSYELFFNEDAAKRRCQCFVQQRSPEPLYAAPPAALAVPNVDDLAQIIREVDGRHSLGAGALAEKIVEALLAQQPAALADWLAESRKAREEMRARLDSVEAPPAAPRVERYGDGVLVHWPEGVEQYVCVGDCVTGNLGAMAVPASDPPVMELIGKYWDLGFTEGKTGVNQADAANELLHQIRRAQAQQPAAAVPNDVARDAARFRFLVEHCSGGYEATEEQPAECHLVFEWQQSKPSERYWTVVNAIDAAMLAAAERAQGECPHAARCDCLGGCKRGMRGNGAVEVKP